MDAVLSLGLKCSFLLCDAAEYLRLGLDLCSTKSEIGLDDKQRVMTNLMGLFEGKIPAAEPGKNLNYFLQLIVKIKYIYLLII